MTDDELELLYKSKLDIGHFAGLRAVFEAGKDSFAQVMKEPGMILMEPEPVAEPVLEEPV